MCLTSDGGSLMAGYTYYPYDTINKPYDAVLQPCLVKCDSQGEMQWVYPPLSGADTTKLGFFTSCTQIGNTYYAAGSHYQLGTQFFLRPLVARFDLNGNLLSYISSEPDTMYHELSQVVSATDTSILLVSAANTVFTNPNYLMVFIADTMGNFKKSFTRTDLIVGQFGDEVAKIRDNKFIIPCQSPLGWPGPLTDVVAIKLDVRLEYDSAYTQQFTYDSLCPYPILSDTSLCNFDPFVELNKPLPAPESLKLNITPNPASGLFEVRGWARDGNMLPANSKLLVFDILGRLVNETPIPSGKQHITIGCDTWPPGIYLIRYMDEKGRTLQASLIVF
ncbi:MAG: T9SS type A sorting domain-containing protein [Bacteroidota bacterium]